MKLSSSARPSAVHVWLVICENRVICVAWGGVLANTSSDVYVFKPVATRLARTSGVVLSPLMQMPQTAAYRFAPLFPDHLASIGQFPDLIVEVV